MADISVEQKSGGQKTWIFALLAVVLIIALMLWLAQQSSEMARVAAVQGDTVGATAPGGEAAGPTGDVVTLEALAQDPESHLRRTVVVQNVPVAAALGPRAFWGDIPGQNPFLVILGQNIVDVQMPVSGQRLNLEGTVQPVTDQVLDDWVTSQTISAGARDEASFATHYLLAGSASRVR
jgi:hypothetical protein